MIHVIDGFYISTDAYQYIVQEDTGARMMQKGKEYVKWNNIGYYGSLDSALERIVTELCNRKTKKKTYELIDYIKEYRAERKRLKKMIAEVMEEEKENAEVK